METATEDKLDSARKQARAQLASIVEMVERLDHARDCDGDPDGCDAEDDDITSALGYWEAGRPATTDERDDYHDEDKARQTIEEDALSVEVRSDWHSPGDPEVEDTEYRILLCTGGPAVQILGDVGEHGQPDRARLMCQDWFTPWTEVILESEESADLLTFAQAFYFGD